MREDDLTTAALQMIRLNPDSAEAWSTLGQALIEAKQSHSAPTCFARATELEPGNPVHWARLGKVLLFLRQYHAAQDALRQACAIAPGSAHWQTLLGYMLREQNDMDGALAAYARARQAEPGNLQGAVGEALLLPPVYRDMADLERWRSRFEEGLRRLHAGLQQDRGWASQVLGLDWENFSLAYQGRDDRGLQESYADFLATLLARAVPDLQTPMTASHARGRKIRVDFLSAELRSCTVGDYFSSWILGLPRDRFEVRCYFTGHLPDELTARLAAGCDRFESLAGSIDTIAARVRGDPPEVLIFPDIGMTSVSYLLANLRLAPIQCAAWGHPVTTGARHIDWYISCAAMEPADAAMHYREKLILLPGLGVRYARLAEPVVRTRSDFGLPEDARIYVCPNRLHKILPDRDHVLLDILAQDPQGVLVFFDASAPGQRQTFIERLQRLMSARGLAPRQQIKFLPMLPRAEFRSALAVADVMLDAPNFSAGSSALDALAAGLPIVAEEGRFMRGRQSAAMLRMVGVPELVVPDERRYVEAALRIARDHALRSILSQRIKAGLPRLFDCSEPLEALAAALDDLVS
jgi:protein O-GlcNAc transferase